MDALIDALLKDYVEEKPAKKKRVLHRNTPSDAVEYFDRCLQLGMPSDLNRTEEESALALFDLAHFPLEQVLVRQYTRT